MGNGRWDAGQWANYSASNVQGKSQAQIFTSRGLKPEYDPAKIDRRESRDSADNPKSTPIILASDVTGSMGIIAEQVMRVHLNKLVTEIYDRKPVTDPHVLIAAVGDAYSDQAPLQVTQFEADIRVAQQATELWLEGNGGGNGGESYLAAPLFAATKVSADAIEKRGRKGYIFTIGDEPVHDGMTKAQIKRVLGLDVERDLTARDIIDMVSREWDYYHIVLTREGYCASGKPHVLANWRAVLPERTIPLEDLGALAETVVSIMQVNEGMRAADVASSWSGSTAVAVANAIGALPARAGGAGGIRHLGA